MVEPESALPVTNAHPTGSWVIPPVPAAAPAPTSAHLLGVALGAPTDTAFDCAENTEVNPAPHLPQIPGYRVLRAVGGGGMGTVFKAVQLALNRTVALKLINSGWAAEDEFRSRFEREAKTLAAIDHPNIVPVYDAGTWQGLSYLTMRFVPGKTLYHRIEEIGRDTPSAVRLVALVARAVQYLHGRGIIHRDLKPLNILLAEDGAPLVADFGLVKSLADDSQLSETLIPLGTRQYMSPEQTRGGRVNYTPACDIWALGVILYELLAGKRPFGHDDPVELFGCIRREPVPPIPATRGVPPALEAVARKCLEKQPADRYAAAEDVAADLERWLNGEPVVAAVAPPAVAEPAVREPLRPANRSRAFLGVCAAAVLAFVAAGAGGAFHKQAPPKDIPPPTVPGKSRLDRFHAGEQIVITDAKGKPTGDVPVVPPGLEAGVRTRDGMHEYFATQSAAVPLCDEFPMPYRVTADLGTSGSNRASNLSLYVGRKIWAGPALNQSFLIFGVDPAPVPEQFRYIAAGHWWDSDVTIGHVRIDWRSTPRPAVRPGELFFTSVEVEVRHDRVVGRVAGIDMRPITAHQARNSFAGMAQLRPQFANELFQEPAFGTGIGMYLDDIDGIATNVTVSKINP